MTTATALREMQITKDEAIQKDSGWHGPIDLGTLEAEVAVCVQHALDDSGLDLIVGIQDSSDEVYIKVAPKPQEVDSSMMQNVSYDEGTRQLSVTFKNGSVYRYFDVEEQIADGLAAAVSKGRFFIRHVRPWYKFERVS